MKIEQLYQYFLNSNGVTTDSRNVSKNQIYFALKGENFNGNLFAKSALEQGALVVVVDELQVIEQDKKEVYFVVANVLETLQKLAQYHRKQLNIPIIALTGSNGKTTTKELIHAVLKQKFKTIATVGNLNNHIGVPLTLLQMNNETEIGIVEMGANHQKEIAFLCELAAPDFGYITNFGKAHLEGFGGFEGVIKGKSEMYAYLREHNKRVFININDALQVTNAQNITQFTFGLSTTSADVNITDVKADPNVKICYNNETIATHLIGIYNAPNICAALTIGLFFGIDIQKIHEALAEYNPTNNRSQIMQIKSNQIILDAYNANPSSMDVALTNLDQLAATHKIAILGDMFELGETSDLEHKNVIEKVLSTSIKQTYFVGERFFANQIENPKAKYYKTLSDLKADFSFDALHDCTVLIKGSRGMALEKILP
ncbi:UDP-N-acetylmuramoyl-tripeptide--D-alanyl-D-alanine ligase [Flavobacterium agricola]|uniref:UDP-N-acetylmuramoyl-tripeptide--D-alanyl-D-alanine ligase n=1 Tax=Flavobacterium agricola TaxID=2870839 RepID=A0ABY6M178_9FLAO|nr:UDP-N-acetylmuramoyl-tripeptide--D-alanyl-D-alanine ligase [Flavobacterium agricola]UYW01470.1 UDP-N-acetylmuramoyl-tripeptide--D-alanyl-D-alanine ligase [Flavobacterium agricola]